MLTLLTVVNVSAQQTPLNPLSYWVFTPYMYNPAMVGSKDFFSLDFNAAFQGKSNAQILSGNTRLSKSKMGYFTSPEMREFNSVGIGGSVYHDLDGASRNVGISGAGSYQIPLSTEELSFLSIGASVKGIYNILDTAITSEGQGTKKSFDPNVDAGIYYFGTNLYAGLSAVNLLGNPGDRDSTGRYEIQAPRRYFFTLGYKFVLSRSQNIVLEPSVLVDATDSTFGDIADNINPIIKLYIDNFCIGSYFLSDGNTSFFFEYRGPRFHGGAFFELPRKTAYYRKPPIVELTLGFNFQTDRSRLSRRTLW
jgi:type IX secretion system PorP/SprF family membrane protein